MTIDELLAAMRLVAQTHDQGPALRDAAFAVERTLREWMRHEGTMGAFTDAYSHARRLWGECVGETLI